MDKQLFDKEIESHEFAPSSSDPILSNPSYSLSEFNTSNRDYDHHHRSSHHEQLVDNFSRLGLSLPSLDSSVPLSSIPFSPSLHPLPQLYPQEGNSPPSRSLFATCPSCGHQLQLDTDRSSPGSSTHEVQENTTSIANNPWGCDILKDLLSKGRSEDIALVFSMVLRNITAVMVDPHGSSLFQKLLEACNQLQRSELLNATIADFNELLRICCNENGATAMRKLVYYCHTREQISSLMQSLGPYLYILATHDHGNSIVERCLFYFSGQLDKDILYPLLRNWEDLARHKFGCFILQRALDLASREDRDYVLAEIARKAFDLAQDSSGNYLLQYALDKRVPQITFIILQQLKGNFASLSIQKYSSNVVEKCLKYTEEAESTRIINELLQNPNVLGILGDRYGNYVIQSALSVAKGSVYKDIVNVVMKHSASLRKSLYGRNIIEGLNKKHIYH